VLDDTRIVGRDAGVVALEEEPLHAAHVGGIHVAFVGEGDRVRFLICALAQPHSSAERDHLLHILVRAPQVRL